MLQCLAVLRPDTELIVHNLLRCRVRLVSGHLILLDHGLRLRLLAAVPAS